MRHFSGSLSTFLYSLSDAILINRLDTRGFSAINSTVGYFHFHVQLVKLAYNTAISQRYNEQYQVAHLSSV